MRYPLASLSLLALVVMLPGCARGPRVAIVAPTGQPRAEVAVEIADTPEKRETGLMYRKHLDADAGMLFVFKSPANLKFWMHNTEIPLDMIFADAGRRVTGIVANAEPYSDQPLGVDADSQYVLELNGGFAAQRGIQAGDRLEFSGFSPQAAQ